MVSASIVTYHTELTELQRCMECLLAVSDMDWVMIVDNGEESRISAFLASVFPREMENRRVRYTAEPNRGYGAGHNVALRTASAERSRYHLVINSDVFFPHNAVETLVAYMEQHADVGQVIPLVLYPDGRHQHAYRFLPTPSDVFVRRFLPRSWFPGKMARYTLSYTGYKFEMNPPFHMGCFMLFRIEALRSIAFGTTTENKEQYFDERFFMYSEDIDITRRIHRHWKTMFLPQVSITHAHRAASYHSLRMLCVHMRSMIRYFNKWGWWKDKERVEFNNRLRSEIKSLSPRD